VRDNCSRHGCLYRESSTALLFWGNHESESLREHVDTNAHEFLLDRSCWRREGLSVEAKQAADSLANSLRMGEFESTCLAPKARYHFSLPRKLSGQESDSTKNKR
jgi:hypothetical protein